METAKTHSSGQISHALYEVGVVSEEYVSYRGQQND